MSDGELVQRDITERITKSFFQVHFVLGIGHFESVYKKAMAIAKRQNGLHCAVEVLFAVYFSGENIGEYRADIVVEDAVIVEVKCGSQIHAAYRGQTFNCLKTSKTGGRTDTEFRIQATIRTCVSQSSIAEMQNIRLIRPFRFNALNRWQRLNTIRSIASW